MEIVGHDDHIMPAPCVSVQAFCETVETRRRDPGSRRGPAHGQGASADPDGRLSAAVEAYQSSPTPNVIILESERDPNEDILEGLDQLANYCGCRARGVVVIGRMNDVRLYRELRGGA